MRASRVWTAASCLLGVAAGVAIEKQQVVLRRGSVLSTWNGNGPAPMLNPRDLASRRDAIKPGTELRILCAGDSITLGTLSDTDGGDGNGYRLHLRNNLSGDKVVFAGTVTTKTGTMGDGYFAAWPGKTIKYIGDNIEPSLRQRPNIILLHAGTNDMNPNPAISKEGNDPAQAVDRLGALVDRMVAACPDAVILVAMIINTCDAAQAPATHEFQRLIPAMVQRRYNDGRHVLTANMTSFPTSELRPDCIHPTNSGYRLLGDYWHDFVAQIPRDWIQRPTVPDPHQSGGSSLDQNLFSSLLAAITLLVGQGLGL
ncbi:hypothetical protein CDD83_3941 [Cordyceps sp. RAO-2017]|nr:hypothetical protein CDD83_3941 [Cordyceps sp. RAO-2017]